MRFGASSRTSRVDDKGKRLCKPWNDARGCNHTKCQDIHKCDVMISENKVCLQSHRRVDHKGPTVPI